MENLYTLNCIRTFSGKYIDVFKPDPEMICIEDIAHGLSNQCRFGGHTQNFYSVAQHSLMCAIGFSGKMALAALLHDASEAYLCDIPSPIKKKLPDYKELENNLMKAIAQKFDFEWPVPEEIKTKDTKQLEYEWKHFVLDDNQILCWLPKLAYSNFLTAYESLMKIL